MKNAIVQIGRRLWSRGLVAGTEGNISVRLDDDRVLITRSDIAKGQLSPEDMLLVDINGKRLQGQHAPSSEMAMHLFVYRNRREITACVHAHPPYATSFSVAGISLADNILPEVVVAIGGIPLTDYAPPGTDSVPKSLEPFIEKNNAFLLRNHGVLTIGRTLDEAYNRLEMLEHYARIVHYAHQLGNVNSIPSEDYQRLERMRQKLDEAWNQES
jgi:L-fuculose-phosphate aldolase